LQNVGRSILSGVISAISRMVAEWIAGRALIAAKEIFFSTKEAAAKAPSALMTSITSYGVAAVVGLAALTAALAAMGSFAGGGFTGTGGRTEPAGLVHRGEFVIPANRVNEYGIGFFEALRAALFPLRCLRQLPSPGRTPVRAPSRSSWSTRATKRGSGSRAPRARHASLKSSATSGLKSGSPRERRTGQRLRSPAPRSGLERQTPVPARMAHIDRRWRDRG
jgi:hypothetical protein